MKTAIKVILILGLVLLGLGVFILFHDFDSPRLGQILVDQIRQATGVRVTARAFRLNLVHGLFLEGAEASSTVEGREFHLTLDRMVFAHRLAPLFAGTVAIDKAIFERPQIEISETASHEKPPMKAEPRKQETPGPGAEEPSSAESRRLALDLRELSVVDGTLTLHQGKDVTRLEELNITLNDLKVNPELQSLAALSGHGTIGLAKGTFGTLAVRDARAQLQLANAVVDMPSLGLTTDYGQISSTMHLDFNPAPFTYTMEASGKAIDLNKMVGATSGLGPGALQLTAQGAGPAPAGMTAHGRMTLSAGTLPSIPALRTVDKILGKPTLVASPYKATAASFSLAHEVLTLAPFRFESESARVDLQGTAALEGAVDIDLGLATPRQGLKIDGVGANVLDALADSSGWVAVPLHISGPLDQPTVGPDIKALTTAAKQGTKRGAKEAPQKAAGRAKSRAKDALRNEPRKIMTLPEQWA